MPHSGLLISTKLIRLQGLWQLIRQLVNLVNDSVFPKAANTLFFRKGISNTCCQFFSIVFIFLVFSFWLGVGRLMKGAGGGVNGRGSAVKMYMLRSQSRIFSNTLLFLFPSLTL